MSWARPTQFLVDLHNSPLYKKSKISVVHLKKKERRKRFVPELSVEENRRRLKFVLHLWFKPFLEAQVNNGILYLFIYFPPSIFSKKKKNPTFQNFSASATFWNIINRLCLLEVPNIPFPTRLAFWLDLLLRAIDI